MKVADDLDRAVARERIALIMNHFDINQSEFAADLEISHGYVSGILAGTKTPSKKLIKLIKKTYKVLDYWWQTGEGEITDGDPNDIIPYREPDQAKMKRDFVEKYITPEYMTIVDSLEDVLDNVPYGLKLAAVSILNKYILTSLVKDATDYLSRD